MTQALMRSVAQAATDAINAHDFSLGVEAVRVWRGEVGIEDTDDFVLTVSPASKQGTRNTRGGASDQRVPVSFVLRRKRQSVDDTVNAVEQDDELADLMQEIETFLLATEITTEDSQKANVVGEFAVEIDDEERIAGVMTLSLTVTYLLCG